VHAGVRPVGRTRRRGGVAMIVARRLPGPGAPRCFPNPDPVGVAWNRPAPVFLLSSSWSRKPFPVLGASS
jgi:hypothetical protein